MPESASAWWLRLAVSFRQADLLKAAGAAAGWRLDSLWELAWESASDVEFAVVWEWAWGSGSGSVVTLRAAWGSGWVLKLESGYNAAWAMALVRQRGELSVVEVASPYSVSRGQALPAADRRRGPLLHRRRTVEQSRSAVVAVRSRRAAGVLPQP